jgi:hypothetical protein
LEYDAEVSSFFHIEFIQKDDQIYEEALWGVIKHDFKGRFNKGRVVFTSPIVKVVNDGDEQYVCTQNSIYKINKNLGEKIKIPATYGSYTLLKSGHSPLSIRQFYSENGYSPLIKNNSIYPENIH